MKKFLKSLAVLLAFVLMLTDMNSVVSAKAADKGSSAPFVLEDGSPCPRALDLGKTYTIRYATPVEDEDIDEDGIKWTSTKKKIALISLTDSPENCSASIKTREDTIVVTPQSRGTFKIKAVYRYATGKKKKRTCYMTFDEDEADTYAGFSSYITADFIAEYASITTRQAVINGTVWADDYPIEPAHINDSCYFIELYVAEEDDD